MARGAKSEHLQIRVSRAQKRFIQREAAKRKMSMSEWILHRAVPSSQQTFQQLVSELATSRAPGTVFAEILDLLASLDDGALAAIVREPPGVPLSPYWQNYLAATLEHVSALRRMPPPAWTRDVPPLAEPAFGSDLLSLRLHLLVSSPPAFVQRNLFIDANVGDRV